LTTWYAGQVAEDAVYEEDTGMQDEKNYRTFFLPFEEALQKVNGSEQRVLNYVWRIYRDTIRHCHALQEREKQQGITEEHGEPLRVPDVRPH